jgi:exopolysaccharide biosynthesis predicted pyruvyltransferase EpsI
MKMITINADDTADSLSKLKLKLKLILDLFNPKSRIFYIDYPVHNNIGDLLINIGTEQFFLDYNIPIYKRYSVLDIQNISSLTVGENDTLLCHGGGNFGDLYPQHQDMREWLVDHFPRVRIIFLPQSIYYSSQRAQRVSLDKIVGHPNCHILARDKESFDILRHAGATQLSMMPDMAHQLWGILSSTSSSKQGDNIYFLRQDQEATPVPTELAERFMHHSVDWRDIVSVPHRIAARSSYYILKATKHIIPEGVRTSMWYAARDAMIRDAVMYFSSHDRIYTNRLHAMILALLIGRDVTAFDNSYGKLSRYVHSWLTV